MKTVLPSIALLLCACGSDVTPPPAAGHLPELERLCRRIDRLVDAMERPPAANVAAPADELAPAPAGRTEADQTVEALQRRIAQLEGEVEILRMQTTLAAGTLTGSPRPAHIAPLQERTVRRLVKGAHAKDPRTNNETLAELLLMGPAQVLQLLGMPTSTYVLKQGSVRWEYALDDEAVYVVFVNGQVMQVH